MKSPISLKRYLSTHFSIVAVVPVVIIAALIWLVVMPAIRARTGIKHEAMARSIAGHILEHMRSGQRQLTTLAEYLGGGELTLDQSISPLLDAQCGRGEFFEAIFIVDDSDNTIKSIGLPASHRAVRTDLTGLDLSGRPFILAAKDAQKILWSETFLSTVSRKVVVVLSVPFSDNLITGEVTLDNLSRYISDLPVETGLTTLVMDGQGRIVGDSSKLRLGQKLNLNHQLSNKIDSETYFSNKTFELDGEQFLGTLVGMEGLSWKVLVAQPTGKAFELIRYIYVIMALGLSIAMGTAVLISWLQAGSLSGLFRKYTEKAQSIASGRYDLQWPQARIKEYHQLGKSLQFMAAEISRREKALVENEERLKDIVSNVPGVVYQFSPSLNVITSVVKEKSIELLGLDSEPERLLDDFVACLPEEDQSPFLESIDEAIKNNRPWHYEGRFIKPSGEEIWFESYSAPRKVSEEVIFYGILTDVSLRKQLEEDLHRLRNYLSNIIDSMPSILVAVDSEGNVTQWNNQTEKATGLSFENVRAQPLARVFPRLTDEMEHIKDSIRQRRVIRNSKIERREEKEIRYEDVTIFPLVANGVEGAVIRVDDVTEQVRLEEMMIQSEKMLSVGGLAAGMAHEINNPLAGIMQTAKVMANRLGDSINIPANQKAAEAAGTTIEAIERFMEARGIPRMLGAILDSGSRVAAIVNNMLSFARKSEATISSHILEELLDKTVELAATDYDLKKQYDFKKIEIRREYAEDLPEVPCEGSKIQQVLLNILRNGAQAMQAAGTISPCFIFRTRFDLGRSMAIIEIEDNGPGMNEEIRKRVFEPFFTTKPVGVGTGLGLSVSFFIITENHGGEMEVDSRPGAGTNFIIRLPVGEKQNV